MPVTNNEPGTTPDIRWIVADGTPRQRGLIHGESARHQIASNLEIYKDWFASFARMAWQEALDAADEYNHALSETFPSLYEEMAGIAEGSNHSIQEIGALNARTEIAYSRVIASPDMLLPYAATECTSFAIEGDRTVDGDVLIGENWDWLGSVLENSIFLHVKIDGGTELVTLTEAGMLAKFGVNSHGIALCNNLLVSNRFQRGLTFHALSRAVLETRSLTAAMNVVANSERAGSGNFLLASGSTGEIVDMEWSPTHFSALPAVDGILTHANNFLVSPPGLVDRGQFVRNASVGTYIRAARAARRLGSVDGRVDMDRVQAMLRDHTEYPEAICRHVADESDATGFGQTNASVVYDLVRQEMHWTVGPPCLGPYRRTRLPWAA